MSFIESEAKMSFSFKLKSHPDKLLVTHLQNVGKLSKEIVNSKCIKNREVLSKVAYLIGIAHDFAKATTYFQGWLENREKRTEKATHGLLSSLFGYYLVKNYLSENIEIDPESFQQLPAIAWIVIKRHHGNIRNIRWGEINTEIDSLDYSIEVIRKQAMDILKNNLYEVEKIYEKLYKGKYSIKRFLGEVLNKEDFYKELKNDLKRICRKKDIKYFFDTLFLYSVILDADKLDASGSKIPPRIKNFSKSIIDAYKRKKFAAEEERFINKVREEAYKEVVSSLNGVDILNERFFSINLPTGIGKTLTGLSFSFGLRKRIEKKLDFTPRIIYCLPFLSIIDQNSQVIEEVFRSMKPRDKIPSNLLLKHHHLVDVSYTEERNGELNPIEDLNKSLLLMEGWNSELIITTFVQFFHSLITNRNRAARKFHNMANSIIILDEVQSIPHKYWLLIEESLTYLSKEFNCWIILMTATHPLMFQDGKMRQLVRDRERYFKSFDRVDFFFDLDKDGCFKEIDLESFKDQIYREITEKKDLDFMIILNTINSCKELYEYLKSRMAEDHGLSLKKILDEDGICDFKDTLLINLSTNILPSFRLKRIHRIKKDKKRKVIVTTQLVEAGVDISVDVVYRDLAPLDCIIQSAGRCNRNSEERKGRVYVVTLRDKHKKFHSYIYDPFLIDVTKEVIREFGRKTSEKDFVLKATMRYYSLIRERGRVSESRKILKNIKKLNFAEISEFNLIEEKLPTISVYVEIDEKAKEVCEKIKRIILEEKGFKRREEFLKMRKSINEYTISVRYSRKTETIESLPLLTGEYFRYVPYKDRDKWYKFDTGFEVPKEDVKII